MSLKKARKDNNEQRFGLGLKLCMSIGSIVAVLLLSSLISVMEYSKMSRYVSEGISKDINSINVARQLSDVANEYNLDILALIGDGNGHQLPHFDAESFMEKCDNLRKALSESSEATLALADSVEYAYAAYMLTSLELPEVYSSDFIDTRAWYFDRLQPSYQRLSKSIDRLSLAIYDNLHNNSEDFDKGYYRSIMPGTVTTGVGLILALMLLAFLLSYYVRPIYAMARGIKARSALGRKYTVDFEGDDQLKQINEGIRELTEENDQFRRRISSLKAGNRTEQNG